MKVSNQSGTQESMCAFNENSITPNENSITPNENSITPNENSITPNKDSITPNENSITLNENSITPNENSITPNENSITPNENSTPLLDTIRETTSSSNITKFIFTSESVGEGHPDKICDLISDSILDECLKQDPLSRVAVDACIKSDLVVLVGEVSGLCNVDYEKVVRDVLREIGYDDSSSVLNYETVKIIVNIQKQSLDISQGLEQYKQDEYDLGAGDQGIMFGYATDETKERMPLTVVLSHRLAERLEFLRKSEATFLRPDCKTQVTVEYENKNGIISPKRLHTVVISTQHTEEIDTNSIKKYLKEYVVRKVIPDNLLDNETIFHLQPSGRFVIGGPEGDSGLTGRKIIVDTYGGWGAHGGGAFSGKDWSKVDRSGAYASRWIAKSLVDGGICKRALVQVSYAIGIPEPLSIFVDTYGTSKYSNEDVLKIIHLNFNLRLGSIVRELGLNRPIYKSTAKYGHFGKEGYSWEISKKLIIKE